MPASTTTHAKTSRIGVSSVWNGMPMSAKCATIISSMSLIIIWFDYLICFPCNVLAFDPLLASLYNVVMIIIFELSHWPMTFSRAYRDCKKNWVSWIWNLCCYRIKLPSRAGYPRDPLTLIRYALEHLRSLTRHSSPRRKFLQRLSPNKISLSSGPFLSKRSTTPDWQDPWHPRSICCMPMRSVCFLINSIFRSLSKPNSYLLSRW